MVKKSYLVMLLIAALLIGAFIVYQRSGSIKPVAQPTLSNTLTQTQPKFQVVAEGLEIPWALSFLPDGRILVTERPGRVSLIEQNGNRKLIATVSRVKHTGEGGLLGITIHPDFVSNNYVYLYYTYSGSGNRTLNRVSRYTLQSSILKDEKVIVDNIPGAPSHNGGRVKFGPDKYLYITTGDAQNPSEAQDKNSLAGKILRVTDLGEAAPGNPFGNLAYSYGHRNPQGLTWDGQGQLWTTEHGSSTLDEINIINAGKNYGWPEITGDQSKTEMIKPFTHSGTKTWAPSGVAISGNKLYFGGLRGQALFVLEMERKTVSELFKGQFGRIREVVLGPDNMLYITTSNKDGRGQVKENDDKIIKITL